MQRLGSVGPLITIHQLLWRNLCDELLLFRNEMNLWCLLSSKITTLSKRKPWLIPHEDSWLLCEGIKVLWIIILWHLLLHILLL